MALSFVFSASLTAHHALCIVFPSFVIMVALVNIGFVINAARVPIHESIPDRW